jgi:tetraacyldisaccharide 4'-kinase
MMANSHFPFWKKIREPWGRGLFPLILSRAFGAAVAARNAAFDSGKRFSAPAGRPTISVGGLSAGGTGKTPMTLLVGKYLCTQGCEVAFLSRGYGRKTKETVVSSPKTVDSWEMVGDEPAMLHAGLPESWLGVGSNRLRAASLLMPRLSSKAIFVLDDGFQHRRLKRDVDIVCLPPDPYNDMLLPSGTLREPLNGLKRAHCICLIGITEEAAVLEATRQRISREFPHVAVFILYQNPIGWINASSGTFQAELPLTQPIAVCGIARPQRFIFFLKKMRVFTSAQSIFSDHYKYREQDIASIASLPGSPGIVTTEKDVYRLKSLKLVSWPDIWYLKIDLQFSDSDSEKHFYRFIDKALF